MLLYTIDHCYKNRDVTVEYQNIKMVKKRDISEKTEASKKKKKED